MSRAPRGLLGLPPQRRPRSGSRDLPTWARGLGRVRLAVRLLLKKHRLRRRASQALRIRVDLALLGRGAQAGRVYSVVASPPRVPLARRRIRRRPSLHPRMVRQPVRERLAPLNLSSFKARSSRTPLRRRRLRSSRQRKAVVSSGAVSGSRLVLHLAILLRLRRHPLPRRKTWRPRNPPRLLKARAYSPCLPRRRRQHRLRRDSALLHRARRAASLANPAHRSLRRVVSLAPQSLPSQRTRKMFLKRPRSRPTMTKPPRRRYHPTRLARRPILLETPRHRQALWTRDGGRRSRSRTLHCPRISPQHQRQSQPTMRLFPPIS